MRYTHNGNLARIARFFGWVAGTILVVLMITNLTSKNAHAYTDAETGIVVVLADTIATPNMVQAMTMWAHGNPQNKAKLRLVVASAISSGYFVKLAFLAMQISNGTGVDTPEEEEAYRTAGRYMLDCPVFAQPLDDFIEDLLVAAEKEPVEEQALSFAAFVIEYATGLCAIANKTPGPAGDSI